METCVATYKSNGGMAQHAKATIKDVVAVNTTNGCFSGPSFRKYCTVWYETKIIIKAFCTSKTIFQGVRSLAYRHLYNFLKTKLITISLQSSVEGMKFYPKLNMKLVGKHEFKSVIGINNPEPMRPGYPKLLGGKTKNKKSSKRKTRKSKK